MTTSNNHTDYIRQGRKNRLIQESNHDPYYSNQKLKESTLCTQCGAVYHNAKWTWGDVSHKGREIICPACQRINDKVPAAFLTLRGEFFKQHLEEITNLVNKHEKNANSLQPLRRIIERKEKDHEMLLSFTDAHLARSIGDALYKAYRGNLDYQYADGDIALRVVWSR